MSHGLNFEVASAAVSQEEVLSPPVEAAPGAVTFTTDTSVDYKVGLLSDYSDKPNMSAVDRAKDALSKLDKQTAGGAYGEHWTEMDDNEAAPILNSAFSHLGLEFIYQDDHADKVIVKNKNGDVLGDIKVDYNFSNPGQEKKLQKILEKIYQLDIDK
jgi:hypothetical protein